MKTDRTENKKKSISPKSKKQTTNKIDYLSSKKHIGQVPDT